MESVNIKIIADDRHAWGIVHMRDLMRITGQEPVDAVSHFSEYSRTNGPEVALEEDCDLPRFLRMAQSAGVEVKSRFRAVPGHAHVRGWKRLPAPMFHEWWSAS